MLIIVGFLLLNVDFSNIYSKNLQLQFLSVSEPNAGRIFICFLALYEQLRDPRSLSIVTIACPIKRQMIIRGEVGKRQSTTSRKAAKRQCVPINVDNKNRKMRIISEGEESSLWMMLMMIIMVISMIIVMMMHLEVRVWSMFFLEVWMIPSPCQLCRKP